MSVSEDGDFYSSVNSSVVHSRIHLIDEEIREQLEREQVLLPSAPSPLNPVVSAVGTPSMGMLSNTRRGSLAMPLTAEDIYPQIPTLIARANGMLDAPGETDLELDPFYQELLLREGEEEDAEAEGENVDISLLTEEEREIYMAAKKERLRKKREAAIALLKKQQSHLTQLKPVHSDLNQSLDFLNRYYEKMLSQKNSVLMEAYRTHMYGIQEELKALRERVAALERMVEQNPKVLRLKREVEQAKGDYDLFHERSERLKRELDHYKARHKEAKDRCELLNVTAKSSIRDNLISRAQTIEWERKLILLSPNPGSEFSVSTGTGGATIHGTNRGLLKLPENRPHTVIGLQRENARSRITSDSTAKSRPQSAFVGRVGQLKMIKEHRSEFVEGYQETLASKREEQERSALIEKRKVRPHSANPTGNVHSVVVDEFNRNETMKRSNVEVDYDAVEIESIEEGETDPIDDDESIQDSPTNNNKNIENNNNKKWSNRGYGFDFTTLVDGEITEDDLRRHDAFLELVDSGGVSLPLPALEGPFVDESDHFGIDEETEQEKWINLLVQALQSGKFNPEVLDESMCRKAVLELRRLVQRTRKEAEKIRGTFHVDVSDYREKEHFFISCLDETKKDILRRQVKTDTSKGLQGSNLFELQTNSDKDLESRIFNHRGVWTKNASLGRNKRQSSYRLRPRTEQEIITQELEFRKQRLSKSQTEQSRFDRESVSVDQFKQFTPDQICHLMMLHKDKLSALHDAVFPESITALLSTPVATATAVTSVTASIQRLRANGNGSPTSRSPSPLQYPAQLNANTVSGNTVSTVTNGNNGMMVSASEAVLSNQDNRSSYVQTRSISPINIAQPMLGMSATGSIGLPRPQSAGAGVVKGHSSLPIKTTISRLHPPSDLSKHRLFQDAVWSSNQPKRKLDRFRF
eukprot:GILJ01006956.1.p1 GENE.GILJ01006956.1~~GILJ01006956.1.p1  ORF type:complete len:923 (+),score=156.69 GILJ01006956.1:162-2930(+)